MEAMEGTEGGQPAQQKPVTNAGRQYYFVSIKVDADTGMTSAAERSPFVGLQIGLLLGKGAYGRVYKGYYHGKVVAVKVSPFCSPFHDYLCCTKRMCCKSITRSVFLWLDTAQSRREATCWRAQNMSYQCACKTMSGRS